MAVDAGARFLVSPSLDEEVIRTGHRYGIPVFPGVSTPTEMVRGLELGADALKLFPASAHDPSWLTEVLAPLPQVPLLPTGGVTVDSAPEWIAAGAVAVGIGRPSDGDRDTVAKRAADLLIVWKRPPRTARRSEAPRTSERPAVPLAGQGILPQTWALPP